VAGQPLTSHRMLRHERSERIVYLFASVRFHPLPL